MIGVIYRRCVSDAIHAKQQKKMLTKDKLVELGFDVAYDEDACFTYRKSTEEKLDDKLVSVSISFDVRFNKVSECRVCVSVCTKNLCSSNMILTGKDLSIEEYVKLAEQFTKSALAWLV